MATGRKVRLSVDCSAEDRKLIKMLATLNEQTISDCLLSLARAKISQLRAPNGEMSEKPPIKAEGYDSSENFWRSLGFGT